MEAKGDDKSNDSTPGLLMKIVRRLLFSCDVDQREKEKSQLQKQFQESDRRLDGLVADHLSDIMLISQAFSTVSTRITASQERIRVVKESLQSCKNLLHCKRDELRRLWIEGVETKAIYTALDAVEQVIVASERLPVLISNRHYLTCTELVVTSLATLETELVEVDALKQMHDELALKKEQLYEQLIDELHHQIYVRPTTVIFRGFQRDATQRQSRDRNYTQSAGTSTQGPNIENDEHALKQLMEADINAISNTQRPAADPTDPDNDPVLFIAVILESLANLRRLPEAVDALRSYVRPGLVSFIQKASQHIAEGACIDDGSGCVAYQPQLLLELLELVWRQCRVIARGHAIILANMHRIKSTMTSFSDFCLYDLVEVWNKIQAVLQTLIADYLDIHNTTSSLYPVQPALMDEIQEIATYFARKKQPRSKKYALFRFEASSHAMSVNNYMHEQRLELTDNVLLPGAGSSDLVVRNTDQFVFVCRRCSGNVTTIYNPLQKYLQEIAQATGVQPSTISLYVFIRDFVRNVFLGQVAFNIEKSIAETTTGITRRNLVDLHTQRELGFPKPLLKSTVQVARCIQELCSLMTDLPDYADQFVNMICKILQEYLDICHAAYQDCVSGFSDERRITSASWVKDDDINRLLRSLPNWQRMKAASLSSVMEEETEDQLMSEDDLYQMNSKESSILTSNLSTSEQHEPQVEIITDTTTLRCVGNLCESMEWFSQRIDALVSSLLSGDPACILPPPDSTMTNPTVSVLVGAVSESTTTTLRSLARHFADINEQCTMLLHVEVRMHCFHYLLPISHGHNADYHGVIDKMEPDENMTRLNKDLASLDEVLQQSIQICRFRYVFEGLGHLVSTILINTAQFLKRINENGIKKMCRNIFSIQQCLTNITMNRESDLDHARQYYELLYLLPDDILKAIVDRGRQFTEQEYIILVSLSHRSEYGSTDTELTARLKKLSAILTECGASTPS